MKFRMKLILFLTTIFSFLSCTLIFAVPDKTNPKSLDNQNFRSVITSGTASFSNTQFIFSYKVSSSQTYNRVYIDTTQDASTGFAVGGIGAKFLLENDNLYSYVGPGWSWKLVKGETFTNSENTVTWAIGRDDMGSMDCAGAFNYVYQVQSGQTISTAPKSALSYTADPNCPTPPPPPPPPTSGMKIAVPSYFDPCSSSGDCGWDQLDSGIPTVGIAMINPDNGPGSSSNSLYAAQVVTTHNLGASVIGYVYTNYAARALSEVEADIDTYYKWYNVDGIFIDNGYSNDCSQLGYYESLNTYVKAKGGKGLTIVNYGTDVPSCYIAASDILVNFEDTYSNYVNWVPLTWYASYPASRFYQIVYSTPQADIASTVQLAAKRNAGWVYLTSLGGSNPYGSLPTTAYWTAEISAVSGS